MTIIPMTVLILIVIVALGGPTRFVNTVSYWAVDFMSFFVRWIKSF